MAFITALVIAGFCFLIFMVLYLISDVSPILIVAALIPLVFLAAYFVSRYVMLTFIYERIKLIYKFIHRQKVGKDSQRFKLITKGDMIEEVKMEVQDWAKKQSDEISALRASAEYRREFMGNISHELKTPIFNIQGYVLTLLDGGLEDKKINREYLLRTEKSINRMISIVEDLDTISRLESGEIEMDFATFDIFELTKEVIEFLDLKIKKKKITVYFAANYERPVYVYADQSRIRQVLVNLIDNAVKYSEKGGRTKISFFDMDENILVEVTDDGIGLDQNELTRIFERFYRTDKARSREQGGSGLGLAIVKHIIDAHGQSINVRSKVGIGTTFAFTLAKGDAK
ncbi:MAG: ATP-binding protein [Bacteroidales bacterium]|nr:ATP-binding protein [Bacteroidales bacterium]